MAGLEISQNLYARISERAFAIKRDIDLAAGPNPIDPCMARAKQNAYILVAALHEVDLDIDIVPEGGRWESSAFLDDAPLGPTARP